MEHKMVADTREMFGIPPASYKTEPVMDLDKVFPEDEGVVESAEMVVLFCKAIGQGYGVNRDRIADVYARAEKVLAHVRETG